jgi:ribosome maturation factor RimP
MAYNLLRELVPIPSEPLWDRYEVGLMPTFFVGGKVRRHEMHTRKSTAATVTPEASSPRAGRAATAEHRRRRPDPSSRVSGSSSSSRVTRWTLQPEIEAEIAEIAAARGCELIHAEWKGGVLRLVLDRPPVPAVASVPPVAGGAAATRTAAPDSPASDASDDSDAPAVSQERPASPSPVAGVPEVAGVSLGDCEQVAKHTSALLDLLDFGNGRYLLEVSSPGLDRQLYRPSDYERFLGKLARVTYETASSADAATAADAADAAAAGAPRRRTVVARLSEFRAPRAQDAGAGAGAGEVTLIDDRTGERLTLRLQDIRSARLEVEL